MANAGGIPGPEQKPEALNPNLDEIEEEEEEDDDVVEEEDDDDLEEDDDAAQPQRKSRVDRPKIENLFRRIRNGPVPLRVHDVIVKGNTKTKDCLIEAELDAIRNATTMQEIIQAANIINYKLRELECFDSVEITLDSGPPELPGTSNVIIQVVETKTPLSGQIGTYTKGEAKSSTVEGSLKYKNGFGYGDLWDASLAYGFDRSAEVSAGVYLPRFKGLVTPMTDASFSRDQRGCVLFFDCSKEKSKSCEEEEEEEEEEERKMSKEVNEEGQTHRHHHGKDYVDPPPAPLIDMAELKLWSFYRALIAEFVATLLFLYVSVATVIGHKKQSDACGGVGLLGIAWAFGGMIFVLVYCTAGISGGHINPAVTFGLFLARKVSLIRAVAYMVAQCLGAICGVGLVKAFMKHEYNSLGGGANTVASGYNKGSALGAEIIGTFVLVYTVFSATDPKRSARDSHVPVLAPLPIGFAVFMVHLATIPITGTGINPARSFGAAVIYNNDKAWDDHWIFWVGPFVGALAAAAYHQYILRAAAIKALGSFRSNPSN